MKSKSEHPVPIIVGGFYRSGTSLVRRLLDAHSRIHCPPEIKFLKDFNGDYLHDELSHLRFFNTAGSMGLEESDLLRIFGQAYIESRELACNRAGKVRWADKNPENALYLKQWQKLLNEDFVFLFVVRHPLDTLSSLEEMGFPKTVPAEFNKKVMLLRDYHLSAMDFINRYPHQSITIQYEHLVATPEEALKSLFNDLNETFEPKVLKLFHHRKRAKGIEDPKVSKTRKIHSNSVDRWKSDLSEEQIKIATKLLSDIFEL